MPPETFEEQANSLISTSFKDGEASDGGMTADEQAAIDADNAAAGASGEEKPAKEAPAEESAAGDDEAGEGAEGEEGAPAEGEEGEQGKEPPPKEEPKAKAGKKSVSERIGDLTARSRTAERLAESEREARLRVEAELAELKSGKKPLTEAQGDSKGGDVPPDPVDFDYGELDPKYIAALARHETAQALKEQRARDDETRQSQAADAQRQEQATKQDELAKAGAKLHDDFDEVVMQGAKNGAWKLSPTMGELLLDSEFGPQIAYELASDPDEADRIFALSPQKQAAHFGRLEAKFEEAKPSQRQAPKVSQVPPPPKTPKGGSGSNKVGSDSRDFAAVEAAWAAGGFR